MKIIKDFKELLTTIAFQLKRNADETEKQSKFLEDLNCNGIGKIKLNSDGFTVISKIDNLQNAIIKIPQKEETQEMIEREIEYQNELKRIKEKCPDLLEFIETISTNYANMDKYMILDTTKMFTNEYIVYKNKV